MLIFLQACGVQQLGMNTTPLHVNFFERVEIKRTSSGWTVIDILWIHMNNTSIWIVLDFHKRPLLWVPTGNVLNHLGYILKHIQCTSRTSCCLFHSEVVSVRWDRNVNCGVLVLFWERNVHQSNILMYPEVFLELVAKIPFYHIRFWTVVGSACFFSVCVPSDDSSFILLAWHFFSGIN